jgi:hypothetical protein
VKLNSSATATKQRSWRSFILKKNRKCHSQKLSKVFGAREALSAQRYAGGGLAHSFRL